MKYIITPKVDFDNKSIEFEMRIQLKGFQDQVSRKILKTEDALTRNALIALGWTPPKQKPESKL